MDKDMGITISGALRLEREKGSGAPAINDHIYHS
jgi:hypothetical protein